MFSEEVIDSKKLFSLMSLRVLIASNNPVKINAIKDSFQKVFF